MRKIGIGLTAALFMATVAAPAIASKPLDNQASPVESGHKVTICHATSSAATHQFWEAITVDVATTGGRNRLNGHVGHTDEPNNRGRLDVIPGFTYGDYDPYLGASNPGSGDLDDDGMLDWEEWAALNSEDAAACMGHGGGGVG